MVDRSPLSINDGRVISRPGFWAIAEERRPFDCVIALGGKSFITIRYAEASPHPEGCERFPLFVNEGDLGRSCPTRLSGVGDI
ncbi:MAG: hypothetical protein WBB23_10990 [Desulforhopalus sp.]